MCRTGKWHYQPCLGLNRTARNHTNSGWFTVHGILTTTNSHVDHTDIIIMQRLLGDELITKRADWGHVIPSSVSQQYQSVWMTRWFQREMPPSCFSETLTPKEVTATAHIPCWHSVGLPAGGTLAWPQPGSSLLISSDPQPNWHRFPISAFCLKVDNMSGTELPTVRNSAAFQCFIHQGKNLFIACSTHFLFSF